LKIQFLVAILSVFLLFGCATKEGNKSIYQLLQGTNKRDCNSFTVTSQYDECIARSEESFEDYDRKRDELMK